MLKGIGASAASTVSIAGMAAAGVVSKKTPMRSLDRSHERAAGFGHHVS